MDGKDSWEGTATELLSNITIVATESKVNIKMWGFPKNPNQLSAILRDTIKSGIQITKKKRYSGRFLKISKTWTMDGGQVDKKIL
jgi:hypothetical protein